MKSQYEEKFLHKTVQFTAKIEEQEIDLDEGMRARVVNMRVRGEGVLEVIFDTTGFEGHNKSVAKHNYWDKPENGGGATLNAWEAGMWPENEKHIVYFMEADDLEEFMVPQFAGMKRDNWTTQEIIEILRSARDDENYQMAYEEVIDNFERCLLDEGDYSAFAYRLADKQFVHIGPILPQ